MNTPSVEPVEQASGSSASATRSAQGTHIESSRIGVSTSAIEITDPETIRIVGVCALAWGMDQRAEAAEELIRFWWREHGARG